MQVCSCDLVAAVSGCCTSADEMRKWLPASSLTSISTGGWQPPHNCCLTMCGYVVLLWCRQGLGGLHQRCSGQAGAAAQWHRLPAMGKVRQLRPKHFCCWACEMLGRHSMIPLISQGGQLLSNDASYMTCNVGALSVCSCNHRYAQARCEKLDMSRHHVLKCAHPSGLSASRVRHRAGLRTLSCRGSPQCIVAAVCRVCCAACTLLWCDDHVVSSTRMMMLRVTGSMRAFSLNTQHAHPCFPACLCGFLPFCHSLV